MRRLQTLDQVTIQGANEFNIEGVLEDRLCPLDALSFYKWWVGSGKDIAGYRRFAPRLRVTLDTFHSRGTNC